MISRIDRIDVMAHAESEAETEVSWLSVDDALAFLGVGLQGYAPPAASAGRTGRGRKTVCHYSVDNGFNGQAGGTIYRVILKDIIVAIRVNS